MQLDSEKEMQINAVELEIHSKEGTSNWLVCNGIRRGFDREFDTNGRKAVPRGGVAIKLQVEFQVEKFPHFFRFLKRENFQLLVKEKDSATCLCSCSSSK